MPISWCASTRRERARPRNPRCRLQTPVPWRTLARLPPPGTRNTARGYALIVDGFDHVAFGNLNASGMRSARNRRIRVEPVQGEGGVKPAR